MKKIIPWLVGGAALVTILLFLQRSGVLGRLGSGGGGRSSSPPPQEPERSGTTLPGGDESFGQTVANVLGDVLTAEGSQKAISRIGEDGGEDETESAESRRQTSTENI